jgi:hypothetical protein
LAGVPERMPVPLPPWKRTPEGRAPLSETVGDGLPFAATIKTVASPTTNVVVFLELNVGMVPTTSEKVWLALSPEPLPAVKVIR